MNYPNYTRSENKEQNSLARHFKRVNAAGTVEETITSRVEPSDYFVNGNEHYADQYQVHPLAHAVIHHRSVGFGFRF